jgi:hypothetical protein
MTRSLTALLCLALLAGCTTTAPPAADRWPDDYVERLSAEALLQRLNAELLSHDSATATLERWCADQHLASEPRIRALRVPEADTTVDPGVRRELAVGDDVPVRHRQVRLACGDVVLSEADNWYVPARLTAGMNATLDGSDAPFGRVVQPLGFRRQTRAVELPWQPLPPDWSTRQRELAGRLPSAEAPGIILVHRAVLLLGDGTPFSYVVERYRREALSRAVDR